MVLKRKTQSVKRKVEVQSSKLLVLSLSLAFCVLRFALPCYAQDKIIAVVNEEAITQKDLNDYINFMRVELGAQYNGKVLEEKVKNMEQDLIKRLVEDRLILQEAKRVLEEARKNKDLYALSRLEVDDNRIKARIEEIKRHYPSIADFEAALAQQGMVQADLQDKIREQILTYNIVELKVKNNTRVTPREVTDYYQKNLEEFKLPEEREFYSLEVGDKDLATIIFRQVKGGMSLEKAAAQYSLQINKLSALKGEELKKEIEDIVFNLSLEEACVPVEIQGKYYIFNLKKIIPPRQLSLDEVQDRINLLLVNLKSQKELDKWLDELRAKSYVCILQS